MVMEIRARGWRRSVVGWQNIAEISLAKSLRPKGRLSPGKTYVYRHGEDDMTAKGNLTITRKSNSLALSGDFVVDVEFSEADLARLLELFFKDRSANDVWQFMSKVFRGRNRRPGKAKPTRMRKARAEVTA
jgi:hypothetical protein